MGTTMEHIFQYNTTDKVLAQYQGFIIDLWGVVHNGFSAYPGVVEQLNQLIANNFPIIFLSNAPRPGSIIMKKLLELGIHVQLDMMLTSGDAVRHQLQHFEDLHFKQTGKCFYHLGSDRNSDILIDLTVDLTETIDNADYLLVTAYMDEGEDLNQHDALLQKSSARQIPFICPNPDKVVLNGDSKRYCAGILAEKYEKLGGTVHYYGKPHRSAFDAAFKKLQKKGIKDKKQVLIIGDTLETDILGGQMSEMASALVLTGNMGIILAEQKNKDQSDLDFLTNFFERYSIMPTWVIPGLGNS